MNHLKRKFLGVVCALTALCLLTACVSTRVTGQRVGAVDGRISRIGVYIQPEEFTGGMAALMGNKDLKTLRPSLQRRFPLVLQTNNIESKAVLGGTVVQNMPVELSDYEYVLRIVPKSSSYSSRYGTSVTVSAEVYRRARGYVWAGTVVMSTLGFGKFEDKLADEIAHDLLVLLNRDGLVSASPLKMPPPAVPEPPKTSTPSGASADLSARPDTGKSQTAVVQ